MYAVPTGLPRMGLIKLRQMGETVCGVSTPRPVCLGNNGIKNKN